MRKTMIPALALAGALATGLGVTAALAGGENGTDAAALGRASFGLTQAVQAAETATGGKAASIDLGEKGDHWTVEIVKGTQTLQVKVSATDGKVLSTGPADGEHEED